MFEGVREWLLDQADSPAGPIVLAALSGSEAVFFPLPPDPLLIALALRHQEAALLLAALTTAASVAGGVVGHWLGRRFGRPLLERLHSHRAEQVEGLFQRYGFWAVVIAGLTPIPYKVFTIAAGVFDIPRHRFVVASIVGRGARFGTIGLLIFVFGDRMERFIDERFDLVIAGLAVLTIVAVAAWFVWMRWRPRTRPAAVPYDRGEG